MTGPSIFRSTGQCLHVAFLMEILPATTRGFMQAMLEAHMKALGVREEDVQERTIDFSGMSALEIRGQCAMVRGMVEHHLVLPEACAVKAHYGHTVTKAAGVRGLAAYVAPLLSTTHRDAVLALAWGVYGTEKQREGLSSREIADYYGLAKSTAQRDQQTIKRMGRDMLSRGIGQLNARFQASGLVENENEQSLQTP
ncbi:hypothetical protein D5039_00155 [Verminephrobacter aporrectodeae subsp. tuberculatae]|uniref:Uncharacterized protein n=1 Tax=Verminephrobacter aporrectodeae subsp. tuberculatae TaxID=1110392 RepID=A0ABT3KMV4_9BURK|nr:hypothetical protein [Verminephrobacter aporrectodeae]MCW5319647.1 hypothetical protein [Verminephrobacter aporrectodeae subsp. tuberculatae]